MFPSQTSQVLIRASVQDEDESNESKESRTSNGLVFSTSMHGSGDFNDQLTVLIKSSIQDRQEDPCILIILDPAPVATQNQISNLCVDRMKLQCKQTDMFV